MNFNCHDRKSIITNLIFLGFGVLGLNFIPSPENWPGYRCATAPACPEKQEHAEKARARVLLNSWNLHFLAHIREIDRSIRGLDVILM